MTELQTWVAPTFDMLAERLTAAGPEAWDAPSLCRGWHVRHVVSHVTMPTRLTPAQFAVEMAAVGGDFGVLSDTLAARGAFVPVAEHVAALRSAALHRWQPPGGGAAGALSHAVIHSLDITVALEQPPAAPLPAVTAVLNHLAAANGTLFGVDLTGVQLEAADIEWSYGIGNTIRADTGHLIALLSGRTLPDGRALRRARTTQPAS